MTNSVDTGSQFHFDEFIGIWLRVNGPCGISVGPAKFDRGSRDLTDGVVNAVEETSYNELRNGTEFFCESLLRKLRRAMDRVRRQVDVARRRLWIQRFVGALFWCWFAAFSAAAVAIAAERLLPLEVDGKFWAVGWLIGAAVAGVVGAIVWGFSLRMNAVDAALEIDRRFGLQERVSSALALTSDELNTPFGKSLAEDAERTAGKLAIGREFAVHIDRRAWLPLIPVALAIGLCFLADPDVSRGRSSTEQPIAISKQINDAAKPLEKKLEQRVQQASDKNLPEMEQLLKKVADDLHDLAKKDGADQHEALSKLNDMAKQLEQRRDALGDGERLKQELAALKNLPSGPADKLAHDIKNGKLDQALKELAKLQEQLAQGSLSEQQQKELMKQLKAMKDSLAKSAEAQKKMLADLARQLERAKQAGDQQGAKDLQSQINRLQAEQPQMAMTGGLETQLQKAAEAMKAGNSQQAQNALNQMQGELAKMQQEMAEAQMLTMTLDDLQGAKMAMSGQDQKEGGPGSAEDQNSSMASDKGVGHQPGGDGKLPDPLKDPKLYDSRVRQDVAKGAVVVTGTIAGPNAKGQALEAIKSEVEAARHDSSDPLTDQRLPRSQRDHVQQYFDAFRKGQ